MGHPNFEILTLVKTRISKSRVIIHSDLSTFWANLRELKSIKELLVYLTRLEVRVKSFRKTN